MSKSCVKLVCGPWAQRGSIIHSHTHTLWTSRAAKKYSTESSPAFPGLHTQIIHKLVTIIASVKSEFSAVSTMPITTTTTYIHIIKKEGMPV